MRHFLPSVAGILLASFYSTNAFATCFGKGRVDLKLDDAQKNIEARALHQRGAKGEGRQVLLLCV
jgi:hypothetical protein